MLKLFIIITIMVFASQCSIIRNCNDYYVLDESRAKCKTYQEKGWDKIEKRMLPW